MPCNLLCDQLCVIYAMSSCKCVSLAVSSCISCMDVHTGRSNDVLMVLTFMLRPCFSPPLFSLWLWHDGQSAINSLACGLYSMCTLYLCIHKVMHCRQCDSVATSLPIITTNDFWFVMTRTSHAKQ